MIVRMDRVSIQPQSVRYKITTRKRLLRLIHTTTKCVILDRFAFFFTICLFPFRISTFHLHGQFTVYRMLNYIWMLEFESIGVHIFALNSASPSGCRFMDSAFLFLLLGFLSIFCCCNNSIDCLFLTFVCWLSWWQCGAWNCHGRTPVRPALAQCTAHFNKLTDKPPEFDRSLSGWGMLASRKPRRLTGSASDDSTLWTRRRWLAPPDIYRAIGRMEKFVRLRNENGDSRGSFAVGRMGTELRRLSLRKCCF